MYSPHLPNITLSHNSLQNVMLNSPPPPPIFHPSPPLPPSALRQYDPPGALQDGLPDQRQLHGRVPLSGLHPFRQHRGSRHGHPHHGGVLLRSRPAIERGREGVERWREKEKDGRVRRQRGDVGRDGMRKMFLKSDGVKVEGRTRQQQEGKFMNKVETSLSLSLHPSPPDPFVCHLLPSSTVKYHMYCY